MFAQRKVAAAVHREGEDPGLACKDRGGGIPLVHIQIDHHQPLHPPFGQQHLGGDRAVVEDAEAAAVVGVGVVGASGQVAGHPVLQG